ncbi:transglycosylase domain-containing protein [Flexibacterium corallicola]|uniref:transglycosylase domain-containing protein n=1 Tax=Flexibacterium corallicola TaxID=3037259 RepID=UPI003862093C
MLALDALLDHSLWRFIQKVSGAARTYSNFMRRFKVSGFGRALVELSSEGLTYGLAGFVVFLAFAQPAMKMTQVSNWRTTSDFSVTFLDRFGNEMGKRGILLNDKVPLAEIPDHLIKATLATEDRRFFDHFGIDIVGTARAMMENVKARSVVQGGSSITQQLAKNLFLTNERKLIRKINEAYLALWMEQTLTKQEILKLYLDRAYMGGGTFGVAAASEFYFGKDVRQINLAEAAMLAALYKAPSKYAPHRNLPAARARANEVLTNIVEAGFMSEGQVIAARRSPAVAIDRSVENAPDYYMDWAFETVQELAQQYPELTQDRVVTVLTTLDPTFQKEAAGSIESVMRQYSKSYRVGEAALVSMTTEGAVRAMVGGRDYDESQFNRATQALRQPGSSFKPFVYITAFMNGYNKESVVRDAPINIGGWRPRNYGRSYRGPVTLKTALTKSINTVPVRLAQAIGREKIAATAYAMGIQTELKNHRTMPLGVFEVTVLDMAASYGAFSTGGYKVEPYAVVEMRNSKGELIYDRRKKAPERLRVLPFEQVAEMNEILVNVVERGTGRRARLDGITAAGKTGTSQAHRDGWFVGYTGNLITSVWYGNDNFTPTRKITGGSLPAMTWGKYMKAAHQGLEIKPMPGIDGEGFVPTIALSANEDDRGPKTPELLNKNSQVLLEAIGKRLKQITKEPSKTTDLQVRLTQPGGEPEIITR